MWPFKRKQPERRRYYCIDEEWRQFSFSPNTWSGTGETCQCEEKDGRWDRSACALHGPRGAEFYEELARDNHLYPARVCARG